MFGRLGSKKCLGISYIAPVLVAIKICLVVIAFSVFVSASEVTNEGSNMYDCLSTSGETLFVRDENAVALLCVFPSNNSKLKIIIMQYYK